jgi:hypothetical protein
MIATTTGSAIENRLVSAVRVVIPAIIVCFFLWRIFGGVDPLARFGDDFFYYAVPARNWVDGAGATFFPGEPTNGYHPLWFVWVTLLYWVAGTSSVFFALVDLTLMVLSVGFFFLFARFLRRVTGEHLAAVVGAGIAAINLCAIAAPGVETALVTFTASLLLAYLSRKPLADQTVRDAAVVGLLGAALLLSRLDSVFLGLGLAVAVLSRWDWRRLAACAAGAAPVYLYFLLNLLVFGHLGTTSMEAKSLDAYWPPNWWLLTHPQPVVGPIVVSAIVVVSLAVVVMVRRSDNNDLRRIALALAIAPLLQLAAQVFMSGWVLFPWYLYFFVMTLGAATALFVVRLRRWDALRSIGIPLGAVIFGFLLLVLVKVETPDPAQQAAPANAAQLRAFAAANPGVYAMGDAAGAPAWVMGQPIVQLEGLVMSHDFLDRIRDQQPLQQVFRDYHVDYYVMMRPISEQDGCRGFSEPNPAQASPRARHMSMTTCTPPVAVVGTGDYRFQIYRIDPTTGNPT